MSIQLSNISKTFHTTRALDQVDFHVNTGDLVALVGPSGSGKTTLLRILAALEQPDPDSGSIRFFDREVSHLSARQRKVGMVFQHYALFRHMTVFENIAFGLKIQNREERPDRKTIKEKVHHLLNLVQLEGFENRLPSQLSGGQRQRIALARALAIEPQILLLDEPFGALDAKVRKDLRKWLRQFHEKMQLTTVFVTHDQEEALELADEVVVMNRAKIEQVGDPQTVFDYPSSPFVIEFMGNVNRLASARTPHSEGLDHQIYVRPHDIEILAHDESSSSGKSARILHIFSAGSFARVSLELIETGDVLEAEISRAHLENTGARIGDTVPIRFRHIRLFQTKANGVQELIETS